MVATLTHVQCASARHSGPIMSFIACPYRLELEHSVRSRMELNRDVTTIAYVADECLAVENCQVAVAWRWSSRSRSHEYSNSMHATEADWRSITGVMLQ
jgi:hypothetical protein